MTTHRHNLSCSRAGCGKPFSSTRSDALFCSRRCRRDKLPASLVTPPVAAPAPVGSSVLSEDDVDAGWRQMGPYLVPPRDPRWCTTVYPE
jgi:hypothetical protein